MISDPVPHPNQPGMWKTSLGTLEIDMSQEQQKHLETIDSSLWNI